MKRWKRNIGIMGLSLSLTAGLLTGCGSTKEAQADTEKKENTETQEKVSEKTQAEHIQFVPDGVRKLVLVENGEEIFHLENLPADYKMDFDYWEILNPYDETATVNTETMYELFEVISGLDFENPVTVPEGTDTGIENADTSFTLDFVDTLDDSKAKEAKYADSTATVLVGEADGEGNRYAAIEGFEDTVYKLPETVLQMVYGLEPFDYILKIPALVDLGTVEKVELTTDKETYEMKADLDSGRYEMDGKKVEKEEFTGLYQEISGMILESEMTEEKTFDEKDQKLTVTFYRNIEDAPQIQVSYYEYEEGKNVVEVNETGRFLVEEADVDALIESIKASF